ncbi:unnamed protein product (macronuclear) [Paramecium tetraurelia]|uniref:Uncharacterized protein n=1 Tax=Paramecium tetraurelia TaxID=5888 RepID=A0CM24_PARTE|nr:uncharacterized protein GSPATT00008320001 [Paramecium tetraurelia]CAK71841.1 unnamed protein product [Paramecium tetraurelia]|eukprot:XP_001439238.1 hypothetical protein (macronuclear) [Paramecium tetraurelia strain d4-2]
MSTPKAFSKPTLQTQKSSKPSLFAPKTGSPHSQQLIKTKQSSSIHIKTPIVKTERARTFNFSEAESKPELKRWDAVGKIEKSINILRKTRGQIDFSFQIKVEEIINQMMTICGVDEKVTKLFLQIREERDQRKQSQLKTLKFIKGQQDQIEQLKRRCEEYY